MLSIGAYHQVGYIIKYSTIESRIQVICSFVSDAVIPSFSPLIQRAEGGAGKDPPSSPNWTRSPQLPSLLVPSRHGPLPACPLDCPMAHQTLSTKHPFRPLMAKRPLPHLLRNRRPLPPARSLDSHLGRFFRPYLRNTTMERRLDGQPLRAPC